MPPRKRKYAASVMNESQKDVKEPSAPTCVDINAVKRIMSNLATTMCNFIAAETKETNQNVHDDSNDCCCRNCRKRLLETALNKISSM